MCYMCNSAMGNPVCAMLDAGEVAWTSMAEIVMPRRVPHDFHGNWMPA